MISKIGQVMLYVNDQDAAAHFWMNHFNFVIKADYTIGDLRAIELAPQENTETTFVLHDKEAVAKMSPELNLSTPSVMLYCESIDELYKKLQASDITVGEKMTTPLGTVFNFSDLEANYFAVMEKKV